MNVCDCPEPPGGSVRCRDDQLAICGYQDGKIVSGCYDRPGYISFLADIDERLASSEEPRISNLVLCNWIILMTTGSQRKDIELVEDSHLAMLRSGQYTNQRTGEVLKFSLPRVIHVQSWRVAESPEFDLPRGFDLPDAVEEDALAGWIDNVAELSRRLRQAKGLAEMNRALADLKVWYQSVVSAELPEIECVKAELESEVARALGAKAELESAVAQARGAEATRKIASGAGKKQIHGEDVVARWVRLLESLPNPV